MHGWLLIVVLAAAPAPAKDPDPGGRRWTLADVLARAQASQPDVRDARLRADEARADQVTAGLIPNPQLQLGLSNVPLQRPQGSTASQILVWGAGITQDVELGGKRGKRQASAEAGTSAGDAQLRDAV